MKNLIPTFHVAIIHLFDNLCSTYYSLFGLIVLHVLMYAANIYFWKRYRVNYSFIFGFKRETELGYRQVLLLGFGIAALALCSVHLNLHMEMDPKTKEYGEFTELLPLNVLIVRFLQILIFFLRKSSLVFPSTSNFSSMNWYFSFPVVPPHHIALAIQHVLSLISLLPPHVYLSLYCCSSLQGGNWWQKITKCGYGT